jgi:carbamoyl-phosphate synthase small subunit
MDNKNLKSGRLILKSGEIFSGISFGFPVSISGEVVFNTGMIGYPESLTDPSYAGQILVLTYPLIGNYGVPRLHSRNNITISRNPENHIVSSCLESDRIQIAGLIVQHYSDMYSHWNAKLSLGRWLKNNHVPAIAEIDTRALTTLLRAGGVVAGKLEIGNNFKNKFLSASFDDPNRKNLVAEVSCKKPIWYRHPKSINNKLKTIILLDCGTKLSIIRSFLQRGYSVLRIPWDYDPKRFLSYGSAIVISNGPGDPERCTATIAHIRRLLEKNIPILGICLGAQLLALAADGETYKLPYGHRSQNQPCREIGTNHCYITAQNHGFAIRKRLPKEWRAWFLNANDGTVEGIKHRTKPFMATQFHPEANPGPSDTEWIFDEFLKRI